MYIYTYTHTYRQLCWRRISSYMDHGSKKKTMPGRHLTSTFCVFGSNQITIWSKDWGVNSQRLAFTAGL